jgi:hypothetical protein
MEILWGLGVESVADRRSNLEGGRRATGSYDQSEPPEID